MKDHAPLLEEAFRQELSEDAYWIEAIEGEVPPQIRGTYYLNGPARFERAGQRHRHWLDGDGMVATLSFREDGVHFRNRFVQGSKQRQEEEAGRFLFRTFGTSFAGDQLVRGIGLASPVNVSVYPFAGKLLAFGEQGLPWELDPETLETLGEHTFGRRLNPVSPFAAHPNFDYGTGEMFNFGVSFSAQRPCLHLYRFRPDGELAARSRLEIDLPRSVHDFGLSQSYAVFYLSPYVLDMEALMAGGATLLECLKWQPEHGSRLLLADRETGEKVAEVPVETKYCLHLISCFEAEDSLFVDVLELDRPVYDQYLLPEHLFEDVRRAQPVRYVVDVDGGKLRSRIPLDHHRMGDFPTFDPRKTGTDYGDFWFLGISKTEEPGRKFFDEVVHCSWQQGRTVATWQAPPLHYLCGEPVFLPYRGSEGGAVICQCFDAERKRGSFLLFDAYDLAAGPIARLHLKRPIHLGFHTCFRSD
ncbi:MAG: carotenoid oxygenase family protein [Acidobacteria bacterium]|nr:carotenoid oxygenase family protein [Acidobacteriota bacterium]